MSIRLSGILLVLLLLFSQISCKKPTTGVTGTGEHGEHAHEEHSEGEHTGEQRVQISPQEMEEFDVEVAEALPGKILIDLHLPGEVVYDPARVVHIVPRVPGIVTKVHKEIGDQLREGEVMAVLESRELASAKANYLAAIEILSLAEATYNREKKLWDKNISSEREYLDAQTRLAEARIQLHKSQHQLMALGFTKEYVDELKHGSEDMSHFEITSPFSGAIVEKHITLGEKVDDQNPVFTVADLSTVWVYLTVYQKDLESVRVGQTVTIREQQGLHSTKSRLDYITPFVEESTRTATARVVLDNSKGEWHPGAFVSGEVIIDEFEVKIAVPRTALLVVQEKNIIFVKIKDGFEPRQVTLGRKNEANLEILSGLDRGEQYISRGGFTLKSELGRSSLEGGGHAH
ncbi:MAG: efflux RND transporter periplasmic adaptor subunit [Candidatus Scalindua sp.]|nr:efflux RND transporter periplasmic adaptor subunit [Candidatus Scalindua sp.]